MAEVTGSNPVAPTIFGGDKMNKKEKTRIKDRRRGGDRRKCVIYVEYDRRLKQRRSGKERRRI